MFRSRTSRFLAYSGSTLLTLYAVDNQLWDSTGLRTCRAIKTLALIGADYKMNFNENSDVLQLHERNSTRLINLLEKNKGLYIKFGQNLANQSSILPKSFQEKFSKLYDSAPMDSWEDIDNTLKQELGPDYQMYFKTFNKTPMASASIAQVHRATLHTGEEVAVKVQHHYIPSQIDADLWTYRFFTNVFSWAFEMPLGFMGNYISERLKEEVDFTIEVENAKKCAQFIAGDEYLKSRVHVPDIYDKLCTKRVMCAEWCSGEPLFNYHDLKTKYDTKQIMNVYLHLFSKMIFHWGFIHSDPHPGNLLVRYNHGKQQLVLLDHGLYITLSPELRHQYCLLWKSLFELNDKELKRIAKQWGIADEHSNMFGTMALLKPYNKSKEKFAKMSRFEREAYMRDQFKNFFKQTEKFPLEMIFMGRTMRMLQLLNQRYRAPVNRIKMFTKTAVSGVYLIDDGTPTSWIRYAVFLCTMTISDIGFYVTKFSQWMFGGSNLEDMMQQKMAEQLKEMGVENPEGIDLLDG